MFLSLSACAATRVCTEGSASPRAETEAFRRLWRPAAEHEYGVQKTLNQLVTSDPAMKQSALVFVMRDAELLLASLTDLTPPASLKNCHAQAVGGAAQLIATFSKLKEHWQHPGEGDPSLVARQLGSETTNALSNIREGRRKCGVVSARPDGRDPEELQDP